MMKKQKNLEIIGSQKMNLISQELELGKLSLQLQKVTHHLAMVNHDMNRKLHDHAQVEYLNFLGELKVLNETIKVINVAVMRDDS